MKSSQNSCPDTSRVCEKRTAGPNFDTAVAALNHYNQLFQYHLDVVHALLKDTPESDSDLVRKAERIFGVTQRPEKFLQAGLAGEAHLLGCGHSAQALCGAFARMVEALSPEHGPTSGRFSLSASLTQLPDSGLRDRVKKLIESAAFKYLSAFLTMLDGHRLVRYHYEAALSDPSAALYVDQFEYEDEVFPAMSAQDYLTRITEVRASVHECCVLLSEHLDAAKDI